MRIAIASMTAAVVALGAASILGVASAEGPSSSPARTVSVQGVAIVPIDQNASAAQANAAYRLGMAAAVSDGQSKAEYLAGKAGATLGAVQSIAEGGGYIQCPGNGEAGGEEYQGEQPDFGSNVAAAPLRGLARSAPALAPGKRRRAHKTPTAKRATAVSCQLGAQVSLTYSIG